MRRAQEYHTLACSQSCTQGRRGKGNKSKTRNDPVQIRKKTCACLLTRQRKYPSTHQQGHAVWCQCGYQRTRTRRARVLHRKEICAKPCNKLHGTTNTNIKCIPWPDPQLLQHLCTHTCALVEPHCNSNYGYRQQVEDSFRDIVQN